MPTTQAPMNPVHLHLRVDRDDKRDFWRECIRLDLSLSDAGRLLIGAVRRGEIDLSELAQRERLRQDARQGENDGISIQTRD